MDECIHGMQAAYCAVCNGAWKAAQSHGSERRRTTDGYTKQEWCDMVATLAEVPKVRMASGSTEPTGFWDSLLKAMNLPTAGTKPAKARIVVESRGMGWPYAADSEDTKSKGGGTISLAGWQAVHRAVEDWKAEQAAAQ